MSEILLFVATHMTYLWAGGTFRIVGSGVSGSSSDASLDLESSVLRLRITHDRSQLLLDLQPAETSTPRQWYSIDLVRRLFTGIPERSGLLDDSYADFLGAHLADVERVFGPSLWHQTETELKRLARLRTRETLG